MTAVLRHDVAWPAVGIGLLVFGFAPSAVLRLTALCYRRDDARRQELLGEVYNVPRIERPFWVAEQLELAVFEGLRDRLATRRIKRISRRPGVSVSVPAVTARRPVTAVLSDSKVPENERFCGDCGQPVGRSRDGRPGLTSGFCRGCGKRFFFGPSFWEVVDLPGVRHAHYAPQSGMSNR